MLNRRIVAHLALSALAGASLCPAQPARRPKLLTTAAAVARLSGQEVTSAHRVDLHGQVTYVDAEWGLLWVQDSTAPVFVQLPKNAPRLRQGDLVTLRGVTSPGAEGALILHPGIRVTGHRALPPPRQVTIAALNSTISQYVEVEGVLRPGPFIWNHTSCVLVDGSRTAPIIIPNGVNPAMQRLVGARVRVRGITSLQLDARNHVTGYQFFVQRLSDIQPVSPNWQPVSQSQPLPIAKIALPDPSVRFTPAVHLRGTVLWDGASSLVLRDSSGSVEVLPAVDSTAAPGAKADVVGFPRILGGILTITEAEVQVVQPPAPQPVFQTRRSLADALRYGHDGDHAVMSGVVLSQTTQERDDLFLVKDHGATFKILVAAADPGKTPFHINPGSILEATGTLWLVRDHDGSPPSAELLVNSLSSLTIREPPPINWRWVLTGIAAFVIITILLWITQLRRALRAQAALIRQQLEHEASLETRYRALFERNLAAVFSWKTSGEITDCNPAFACMLGFDAPEQVVGLSYWSLLADESQRHAFDSNIDNLSGFETSLRRADGATVHLLENITSIGSGESIRYETTALDITQSRRDRLELQEARDASRREAEHDILTGLPNRRYFVQLVSDQLGTAALHKRTIGMLFIDLDGFKAVNDTHGHLTGDLLLQEVATRLNSCLLAGDFLCRLGGDEFAVLLTRPESIRDAVSLAHHLLNALGRPIKIAQSDLIIGAGIGISFFPQPALDFSSLLKQADSAMYLAKRSGRNHVVKYSPEIGTATQEKNRIAAELHTAIAREEITVHYQPQFSASNQRLVRFEALARWSSAVLGDVPPSRFIPIAEENGAILELGAHVLATACREAVQWQRKTGHSIPVAVNISSIQFRSESFVDDVLRTLSDTGLLPHLLELEMTESIMLDDLQRCREMLTRLSASGIRLAIDDFGTGYSSLAYLQDLPFDRLKIAPAFLAKAHRGRGGEALIQAVLSFAHALNLSVIVEGIETAKDLDLIRSLGADELQGFLLGRPGPDPCSVIASHLARPAGAANSATQEKPFFAPPISSRPEPS